MKWNWEPTMKEHSSATPATLAKRWTIQIDYTTRDDDGKAFRARSCLQFEAVDLQAAYAYLDLVEWPPNMNVKYGAMLPGWHNMIGV